MLDIFLKTTDKEITKLKEFNPYRVAENLFKLRVKETDILKLENINAVITFENLTFNSTEDFLNYYIPYLTLKKDVIGLKYQKIFNTDLELVGAEFFCQFSFPPLVLPKYLSDFDLAYLDFKCLQTVLKETKNFRAKYLTFFNSYTSSWNNPVFVASLIETLKNRGSIHNLVFEVLEQKLHKEVFEIFGCFKKNFNVKFAYDDFGTENASLLRLQHDIADFIKIAKEILWDKKLWNLSLNLFKNLTSTVIVEGIETEEHLIQALELGKNILLQGYLLHKPENFE